MIVPGSNILALANRAIATQTMQYAQFSSRAVQTNGMELSTYLSPITIQANIQPVPRQRYEEMGLDFQKNYAIIYIQENVTDIARDVAGDQFTYNGKIYEAISKTDWFAQDGWVGVLSAQVPS